MTIIAFPKIKIKTKPKRKRGVTLSATPQRLDRASDAGLEIEKELISKRVAMVRIQPLILRMQRAFKLDETQTLAGEAYQEYHQAATATQFLKSTELKDRVQTGLSNITPVDFTLTARRQLDRMKAGLPQNQTMVLSILEREVYEEISMEDFYNCMAGAYRSINSRRKHSAAIAMAALDHIAAHLGLKSFGRQGKRKKVA